MKGRCEVQIRAQVRRIEDLRLHSNYHQILDDDVMLPEAREVLMDELVEIEAKSDHSRPKLDVVVHRYCILVSEVHTSGRDKHTHPRCIYLYRSLRSRVLRGRHVVAVIQPCQQHLHRCL